MKYRTIQQCWRAMVTLGFGIGCMLLSMSARPQADDQVTINFRDAEISSVIESVAEITGRSFVLDPRVSGRITIISPNSIEADMLYQAFLSAIQVQGFQAVDDGAVTRIVPFNQAFGMLGGGDNELETRLFKVNSVEAASLVPVVRPLLSSAARIQAFAQSNYLVVTDISGNITALEDIIAEMDDPSQAEIEVVNLEHIAAGEAVHIVSQLQQMRDQGLTVVEDSLNNRLIISGPSAVRAAFKNMLATLDVPSTRTGGVEVIYLNFAKAEEIKPILDGMLASDMFLLVAGESTGAEGESDAEQQGYRVEVDESNNAIIVAASPAVLQEIRNVVQQLDIPRPQVLIEAVIAELSQDQAQRLSAQLAYIDQDGGGYLSKFDNILTTLLGLGADGDVSEDDLSAINSVIGDTSGGFGVGGSFDSDSGRGFALLIQALKSDSRTRVLSTPSVVTLNNEEAMLSVGQEVPFVTGSYTNTNNDASNPFQTIEREDVGIKLTVQPQISSNSAVRLSLQQENSKLITNSNQLGTADVVTSKSEISTNVMVEDGEMLVLGGLIEGSFGETETKVPLLGDIPLLGSLFRSTSGNDTQRVLMVFIRPTILRDAETARAVSSARFNHLITTELGEEESEFRSRLEKLMNNQQFTPVEPAPQQDEPQQ